MGKELGDVDMLIARSLHAPFLPNPVKSMSRRFWSFLLVEMLDEEPVLSLQTLFFLNPKKEGSAINSTFVALPKAPRDLQFHEKFLDTCRSERADCCN